MKKHLKLLINLLIIISLGICLVSCDIFIGQDDPGTTDPVDSGLDTDGDGISDSEDSDIDGDGLSNDTEIYVWKTNPLLADTDGDGWSDGDETNMGSMFSPLLANMPELQLEITTTPEIILTGENSSSESREFTIAEGSSVTSETSISKSLSESSALENAWSLEGTLGYNVGFSAGYSFEATAGYSGSYTTESGYSWGTETTESNTESIEQSETYADEQSVTYDGGTLSVGAKLVNPSNIAYTIDSLLISGYKMNTLNSNYGTYSLLGSGNMTIDNFSSMTLSPNSSSGELILTQTFDSPDYAKDLAQFCPSMIFSVSGYTSTMTVDGETTDFTEEMTTVAALCAKIIVTPGTYAESEQYLVAARTKYNEDYTTEDEKYTTLSLTDIFENMDLVEGIDYFIDASDGHITTFDGYAEDSETTAQWLLIVEDTDDEHTYYTASEGYDLDTILIEPGYIVNLCYSTDQDGDGLVLTIEEMYGSSDEDTDSDDDGITDNEEVLGWDLDDGTTVYTHPAIADTDGDGINDKIDDDPVSFSTNTSATINKLTVTDGDGADHVFDEYKYIIDGDTISGEYVSIEVEVLEAVSSVKINNIAMTKDSVVETLYTYEITSIPVGDNDYTLTVTSEDGNEQRDYTLTIESSLEDLALLSLLDEGLNTSGDKYQMDLGFNWGSYTDSRAEGALLVYISGESAPTDYELPTSDLLPRTLKQNTTADTYASGETAVYYWESASGTPKLETSCGSFFRASYYDETYAFRIIPFAQRDGKYYYAPGTTDASMITPYPDTIEVDRIDIKYTWDETENNESSPEFIINTNLEDADGNYVMDISTRSSATTLWEPDDGDSWTDETDINLQYDIPTTRTDCIFGIWYDIDEDEAAGEHDIVQSERRVQFIEKSNDGIYGMNDNGKYAGSTVIDTQTYSDNDKGDFSMEWEVIYHTVDTE